MVAAGLEVCCDSGATYSSIINAIKQAPVTASDTALAVAFGLWTASGLVEMAAPAPVHLDQLPDVLAPDQQAAMMRQVGLRNKLIKIASTNDMAASVAYGLAGYMMGDNIIAAAGGCCLAADFIRRVGRQGDRVSRPEKDNAAGMLLQTWRWARYGKRVLVSNPNSLAEVVTFPALVASCIELPKVLPPTQSTLVIAGLVLASTIRSLTTAMQKIPPDRGATHRARPQSEISP